MANRKQPRIWAIFGAVFRAVRNILAPVARIITHRPSIAAGSVAFAVAFGFVSINALQYQHGKHPSPFFDTRHPGFVHQSTKSVSVEPKRTHRVDDRDPVNTSSIPPERAALDDTIPQLQEQLMKRGLYDGEADGIPGPKTREAILKYQKLAGLPETGEPSDELLVHLLMSDMDSVVRPGTRPVHDIAPIPASAAPKPSAAATATIAPAEEVDEKLVIQIQKGLSNIAYTDVKVDGVVGQQTATAIRDFQMHYRLPVTGMPDRNVLEKLQEIGAL
jgi:peptidoglycan hydrolase-like protein with peptidoglycan-binding domain